MSMSMTSGVARGLLQGRPLQLPMGWGVGDELTKSRPTFEQLCVQNLALAISYFFYPTKSAYKCTIKSGWLEVDQELDNSWPTFDTNISVLKLQGSYLQWSSGNTQLKFSRRLLINVYYRRIKSTPYFRRLASISMLSGREVGAGWWAWEHCSGREEVVGLERAVGDWRSESENF